MGIRRAIVPMAGFATRLYPLSTVLPKGLMPFVLPNGSLTTGFQLIAESLFSAGIEQIGLIISPETQAIYERFLSGSGEVYARAWGKKPTLRNSDEQLCRIAEHTTLILQEEPHGLGHAVWCAHTFAQEEPMLIVLGDHIPLANGECSPVSCILQAYESLQSPVYAVHTVPLEKVSLYGILKGTPTELPYLYRLESVVEKPSQEEAQRHLRTSGLPEGQFFAHYGLYAMPSEFWTFQEQIARCYQGWGREWHLVDTQQRMLEQMPAYLLHLQGESLDFGTPEGYRNTFTTLATSEGVIDA